MCGLPERGGCLRLPVGPVEPVTQDVVQLGAVGGVGDRRQPVPGEAVGEICRGDSEIADRIPRVLREEALKSLQGGDQVGPAFAGGGEERDRAGGIRRQRPSPADGVSNTSGALSAQASGLWWGRSWPGRHKARKSSARRSG